MSFEEQLADQHRLDGASLRARMVGEELNSHNQGRVYLR